MPLDEAYLVWLYRQVGPDSIENRNRSRTYWTLLRFLYRKEFTWSNNVSHDENRAHDGTDLRRQFLEETGLRPEGDFLEMGCSFLEMLVALSWAVSWEGGGTQAARFWEIIENLGLITCADSTNLDEGVVNQILDRVINREYAPNGAGGMFPLANPEQDQRDVEIRYQSAAYLLERMEAA